MWLATKIGFFSIVQKTPSQFHVRARFLHDIEALCDRVGWKRDLISHREGTDYPFRVVTSEEEVRQALVALAGTIDYGNFKHEIGQTATQVPKLRAYANLWYDLHDLQHRG